MVFFATAPKKGAVEFDRPFFSTAPNHCSLKRLIFIEYDFDVRIWTLTKDAKLSNSNFTIHNVQNGHKYAI